MSKTISTEVPRHLGMILDGNRRWAKAHGSTVAEGHRQGFLNARRLWRALFEQGVEYVSAYVFSTENWNRSKDEVRQLMKLFMWVAKHEVKQLHQDGIRIRIVGSKLRLGKSLLKALHEAEELTKENTRGTLLLCLDYGGQEEVVDAVKAIAASGVKPADITAKLIDEHLYAADVPSLDLIIRTSGEQRLSNFMLWRAAYSEFMYSSSYWPDFSEEELNGMIKAYSKRRRRFGK